MKITTTKCMIMMMVMMDANTHTSVELYHKLIEQPKVIMGMGTMGGGHGCCIQVDLYPILLDTDRLGYSTRGGGVPWALGVYYMCMRDLPMFCIQDTDSESWIQNMSKSLCKNKPQVSKCPWVSRSHP